MVRILIGVMVILGIVSTAVVDPHGSATSAQEATPAVTTFADVEAEYRAAEEWTLANGREITETLLTGNSAMLVERLSPELNALMSPDAVAGLFASLQQDQVRFEIPELNLVFNGYLDGETLEGFLSGGGTYGFGLSRTVNESGDLLAGTWSGAMTVESESFELTVTIDATADGWSGTAAIPAWDVAETSLEGVSFAELQPIGAMIDENAMPHSPALRSYWASYAWGEEHLSFQYVFDQAGTVTVAQVAPEESLPVDPAGFVLSDLVWPLPGLWWVGWGGESILQNYHAAAPSQRHALDLLVWRDGGTFAGDGTANHDYFAWGQEILAPAAGTVVDVLDGLADNTPGVIIPQGHPAGNHVVLQTGDSAYIYLAHMQEGSVAVSIGDVVEAGQVLGLVGNSGNSTEPHLHIHAQSIQDFYDPAAIGIPLEFANLMIDGVASEHVAPAQGAMVEDANATPVSASSLVRQLKDVSRSVASASAPAQLGSVGARLIEEW